MVESILELQLTVIYGNSKANQKVFANENDNFRTTVGMFPSLLGGGNKQTHKQSKSKPSTKSKPRKSANIKEFISLVQK